MTVVRIAESTKKFTHIFHTEQDARRVDVVVAPALPYVLDQIRKTALLANVRLVIEQSILARQMGVAVLLRVHERRQRGRRKPIGPFDCMVAFYRLVWIVCSAILYKLSVASITISRDWSPRRQVHPITSVPSKILIML
jgi:hypothetical protein